MGRASTSRFHVAPLAPLSARRVQAMLWCERRTVGLGAARVREPAGVRACAASKWRSSDERSREGGAEPEGRL